MKLEYYYLFGLDIPLKRYSLGVIRQPKLIDFINEDVDIDSFYAPFIFNEMAVGQSDDKEKIIEIKNKLGSLTFLLTTCYQAKRFDVLVALKKSIGMLYGCNAELSKDKFSIVAGDVSIDDSNFDALCELVLEMYKIDKSKLKFEKKPEYDDRVISDKMLEAKRKFLEMNKGKKRKDDTLSILDIANIVIHSKSIDYEKVINMTIYQLKNSFEVLNIKESFDVSTLYRVSPKFDTSKEKYEHWTEKVKINKSRLDDNV
ncbi:MAG: hypothetical protein ACRC18_07205 [Cetobacterium sp.]